MWDWYVDHVVDTGRSAALWMLIGFVVTYAVTRTITVRIKNRKASGTAEESGPIKDVHIGGVHVHHQVWGILLVLVVGLLTFRFRPESPWIEVLATLFGVGAALALDEFALWLHLEDVYWSEEGKKSIDAVMIAAVFGLVLLTGTSPIGVETDTEAFGAWVVFAAVLLHVLITRHLPAQGQDRHGPGRAPRAALLATSAPSGWPSPSRSGPGASTARRSWPGPTRRHERYEARRHALRDRLFGG